MTDVSTRKYGIELITSLVSQQDEPQSQYSINTAWYGIISAETNTQTAAAAAADE